MENNQSYCVYKHTSRIDGRAYVGITRVGTKRRWLNGKGYKKNVYFWRYIEKYGWDSLTHEIIADNLTEQEAIEMERELIGKWDLTNKNKGFNLDAGGSTNNSFWRGVYCINTLTEYEGVRIAERILGISANHICYACSGKRPYAGKDYKGHKLHWVYLDEKDKIPFVVERLRIEAENLCLKEENMFKSYQEKCVNRNVTWTREDLRKTIYQYDLQGKLISTYSGLKEAAEKNGCNMTEIGQRCNGYGYTCGGYMWSYEPKNFSEGELLEAQNASNRQTILQYDINMNLIAEYPQGEGLINNPDYTYHYIRNVCRRFKDTAYGYVWRFKGESKEQFEADKEHYARRKPVVLRNCKINQLTPDGELVNTFGSLADAEKQGWGRNMVSQCCRGIKSSYRGYIWKYANEVAG